MMESNPDPQAMLMVTAVEDTGIPDLTAIWRATLGPPPAWRPQPNRNSSTRSGEIPARSSAGTTAATPRSAGERDDNPPRNFPMGVLTAEQITALFMNELLSRIGIR